ncbi:MAG: hypothetical protein QOH41_4298 [Blastocatellia bacterium]|jgi:hypothetical protein|nr:hypothetical protein [Blastocatellia bacterium]
MSQNQQIEQTTSSNDKAESGHSKTKPDSLQVYRPRLWRGVLVTSVLAVAGIGGFAWLYWASLAFSDVIDGLKFLTEGSIALALLIVAAVQASVYWSQRGIMRGQWEAMIDALKQATRQADIAGDALLINNRASVGVHSIEFNRNSKIVFVRIENIGHVPAKEIELFIHIIASMPVEIVEARKGMKSKSDKTIKKSYGKTELFRGNLQIIIPINLESFLAPEEIRLIVSEDALMLIRGYIDYTDGFLGQPRKRTEFVFTYDADGDCWSAEAPEPWNALIDMETPAH